MPSQQLLSFKVQTHEENICQFLNNQEEKQRMEYVWVHKPENCCFFAEQSL